jgi:hypothetical protein
VECSVKGIEEGFSSVGEGGFDDTGEALFVIEGEARLREGFETNDGGIDIGLGVKAATGDDEDASDIEEHAEADGEDGVIFAILGLGGEACDDLFLEHEDGAFPKVTL